MKLDNAKRAGFIKLIYMLVPLLFVIAAAVVYLLYEVKDLRYMLAAFIAIVLFFALMAVFRFTYIVLYVGPDKIQIRYKKLSAFNTPNSSVKMQSENFRNYELKNSFFGWVKVLYLFQETPSGLAKYPGIGVTALNRDELDKIKKAFDLILAMNKSKSK